MRQLALIPLLSLAVLAAAQGPSPKEILLGRKIFMALTPQVKEELKVTSDQTSKLLTVFGDTVQVDGDKIMIQMTPDTDLGQIEKDAMAVFTADQRKRLDQLWVQRAGGLVLLDDEMAKSLKLTDDQKKSVEKLGNETADKMMELFSAGHDEATVKQSRDLRKEAGKKMEALLTEEQKKTFEGLKGTLVKWKDDGR